MPRLLRLAALYVVAIAAGVGSAWWSVRHVSTFGASAGPWRASLLAGSPDADLWTRARVAVGGLLALNREETMYYVAATDSGGRPLASQCTYRVSGRPPRARWWSVTAYADDFFLFDHPERRYSVNGLTARLDGEGRFAFVSAPQAPPAGTREAWLPTPGKRGLIFTLRVYNPESALAAAPESLEPPRIERSGECR